MGQNQAVFHTAHAVNTIPAGDPFIVQETYGYWRDYSDNWSPASIPGIITTDPLPVTYPDLGAQIAWQPAPSPHLDPVEALLKVRMYNPAEVPDLASSFFSKVAMGMGLDGENVKVLFYRYIYSVGGCVTFDLINKNAQVDGMVVLIASITLRPVGTTGSQWEAVEQFLFNENGTRCFIEVDKPAAKEKDE